MKLNSIYNFLNIGTEVCFDCIYYSMIHKTCGCRNSKCYYRQIPPQQIACEHYNYRMLKRNILELSLLKKETKSTRKLLMI